MGVREREGVGRDGGRNFIESLRFSELAHSKATKVNKINKEVIGKPTLQTKN